MKRLYVCWVVLGMLCLSSVQVNAADDLKSMVTGKWLVSIPDVPVMDYGFIIDIKEKDNAIVFDMQGEDIDIKDMKFTEKNGKLSATVYVGEYVKLSVWEENGAIKGSADTSMLGMMRLVLKKIEK